MLNEKKVREAYDKGFEDCKRAVFEIVCNSDFRRMGQVLNFQNDLLEQINALKTKEA